MFFKRAIFTKEQELLCEIKILKTQKGYECVFWKKGDVGFTALVESEGFLEPMLRFHTEATRFITLVNDKDLKVRFYES